MTTETASIRIRRDTLANWTTANPALAAGELALETDTGRLRKGDGTTPFLTLPFVVQFVPAGTRGSPTAITAVGGITASAVVRQLLFVVGSGGPVTVSSNPQISAGTIVGQELVLKGTDNTNTVTIQNGTGLELNGPCPLRSGSQIYLVWDGTVWGEVSRNGI